MKKRSIHTLMHVPYEGLGCIENWTKIKNYQVSYTKFYEDITFPDISDIDMLIIMGGPMSVYEELQFPWLIQEKTFIKSVIEAGKTVLGICLGSQLLAEVLGAKVYPNHVKEIGWFDIQKTYSGKSNSILSDVDEQFKVFHWHGDTYDIPPHCEHLFQTPNCRNQAFLYNNKVLGLQFHFEVTESTLTGMVENGKNELKKSETVQSAEEILSTTGYINNNNKMMYSILDRLENQL